MSEKSNIVPVKFGPRGDPDLPATLRELADAVERGEVNEMVFAYVRDEQYCTEYSASLQDALVLATLLHTTAIDRFRK